MPDATVADFLDHGTVARTIDTGVDEAEASSSPRWPAPASTWRTSPRLSRPRASLVRQVVRRAHAVAHRQSQRALRRVTVLTATVPLPAPGPPTPQDPENRAHHTKESRMKIAMIGLGKMGANMTQRLIEHGHEVVAFDLSEEARTAAVRRSGPIRPPPSRRWPPSCRRLGWRG
jgi:hypothetical protein